jgi:hypothetical protein
MNPVRAAAVSVTVLAVSAGCSRPAGPPPPLVAGASAPAAAPPSATAQLEVLDKRKPVPLLPMMANHQKQNMREHLDAVQGIVTALAANDFAAVEESARRIGYSEQMGTMCTHMGAAAEGFTPQALQFHRTADTIAEAARRKDTAGVFAALSATLTTCTACHATWKQQVVDEATWTKLAGQPAPQHHMP